MTKERLLAIDILEAIAGMLADKGLAKETIFDCKKGEGTWYDFEDMITEMIKKYKKKIKSVAKK